MTWQPPLVLARLAVLRVIQPHWIFHVARKYEAEQTAQSRRSIVGYSREQERRAEGDDTVRQVSGQ